MPTAFLLRVWTRFFATPDEVWARKTDPAALSAEFRPYFTFSADAVAMANAFASGVPTEIPAKVRPFGLPPGISWPVRISEVRRPELYSDTSENRIYSRFSHVHSIEVTPDGCRYIDAVTFAPRAFPKATALLTERLFRHRHRVAAKAFTADPQAIGVSVLRVLIEEEVEA